MQLNLRKARKLEQKIQKHIDGQHFNTNAEVRVKGTVDQALSQIDVEKKVFLSDIQQINSLLDLRFAIRNRIGKANTDLGINDLMSSKELLEAKRKALVKATSGSPHRLGGGQISTTPDKESLDDLLKARAGILDRSTNDYGVSATLTIPILSDTEVKTLEQQGQTILQQQEDIEDQLSQKNIGGTVTLTADEVTLLKAVGLA